MIYKARELNAKLHNLTLCGIDGCGVLEWIGNDDQWYQAEVDSLSITQLIAAENLAESDSYDLSTCNK